MRSLARYPADPVPSHSRPTPLGTLASPRSLLWGLHFVKTIITRFYSFTTGRNIKFDFAARRNSCPYILPFSVRFVNGKMINPEFLEKSEERPRFFLRALQACLAVFIFVFVGLVELYLIKSLFCEISSAETECQREGDGKC